jgi:hypothetical protein
MIQKRRYSIDIYEHGLIVRYPLPLADIGAIEALASAKGWDIVDGALSAHTGVVMAICSKEGRRAFWDELDQTYPEELEEG